MKISIEDQYETEVDMNNKTQLLWNNFVSAACESIDANKDCTSQQQSYISLELEHVRENFKKLFTTHIQEYKPTGETPLRKKYRYPKCIPVTQTNENLLKDFIEKKENITNVSFSVKYLFYLKYYLLLNL